MFFFVVLREVCCERWSCALGLKSVAVLSRMCFSQVGNCDIENAREHVGIKCLGGIGDYAA